MQSEKLIEWRKFLKSDDDFFKFEEIKFPEFQINNLDLTLNEIPDPDHCRLNHMQYFALTYNAYNIDKFEKEFTKKDGFYGQYFKEGKHKDSLDHLRAILFYTQRLDHMGGPMEGHEDTMRKIIRDIRNLLKDDW